MRSKKKQFEIIYTEHIDEIYRFCLYKTGDRRQTEDLTQECFIRFWNYLDEGKEVESVKSLLYQIARNLITDYYRKKKTLSLDTLQEQGFEASGNDNENIVNESEKNIAIETIQKLDDKYRDIVYMKLVEDIDIKKIAGSLDITVNNATVRFHRGLKQLHLFIETQQNEKNNTKRI